MIEDIYYYLYIIYLLIEIWNKYIKKLLFYDSNDFINKWGLYLLIILNAILIKYIVNIYIIKLNYILDQKIKTMNKKYRSVCW